MVTMTTKELTRIQVIRLATQGSITNFLAAERLNITTRQVMRLKKTYNEKGATGMIHGNAGRLSWHAITDEVKIKVTELFREKYYDHNFSHFTERLNEEEEIAISLSSVRRILKAYGIKSKRTVRHKHQVHRLRPRKVAAGMMWQTDATKYQWFGKERPYATLHAFIDDATGIVTGAFFTDNECLYGYTEALRLGIVRYGLPWNIYSDRHTIFRSPKELSIEEELRGEPVPMSNFGKSLRELGIKQIMAHTPEAKGRIERLWNTFQDRLTVEFRHKGITTIAEANAALTAFLKDYNRKFAVVPATHDSVYIPVDKRINLKLVLARRTARKTGGGITVSYNGRLYAPAQPYNGSMKAKCDVDVRETVSGDVYIVYKDEVLLMKTIPSATKAVQKDVVVKKGTGIVNHHKPAPNHPWRGRFAVANTIDNSSTQIRACDIFSEQLE